MNRDEVIERMCAIHGVVAHSHAGEFYPADCFCRQSIDPSFSHYQNTGKAIEYIRQAVMEKMKRDGVAILSKDFDTNGEWMVPVE